MSTKSTSTQFCIYTLGPFSMERRLDDGTWETVDPAEWGPKTYRMHPQRLLGYLLSCPNRQALIATVMEKLWHPKKELASVDDYMRRASARLGHILSEGTYFRKTSNRTKYELADQSVVWSDADACIALMQKVEQNDLPIEERRILLEEAERLFRRGRFLEGEAEIWAHGPREELTKRFCRCRQYLVEAYLIQGEYSQAERVAEAWLRESPFEETALRPFMRALHEQNMTHEALRYYRETSALAKKEGSALSSEMEAFAQQLPHQTRGQCGSVNTKQGEVKTSPRSANPSSNPPTGISSGNAIVVYGAHVSVFVQPLQNEAQSDLPQLVHVPSPYLVESNAKNEGSLPSSSVPIEGTMEEDTDPDLEREDPMERERRNLLQQLKNLGLVTTTTGIPVIVHQDLIRDVRSTLYPSGPGDKELKYLEQKIRYYWQDRHHAIIAPADLVSHAVAYVQGVTTLLKRSLLPSIRTRLCACLSQGMLLIGVNCYDAGQFQTARVCFQTALEAAHEANSNILQSEAWNWDSFSWVHSHEKNRYKRALDSMRKACGFASLESDLAVQCNMQADLAEVYAYLKDKAACIEALEQAGKMDGNTLGDWHYIHHFGVSSVNGFRGRCLQQFYRRDASDTDSLLEEARQALQGALSQPSIAPLKRAFTVADMAQIQARKGEVESACKTIKEILGIAEASAPLRQRLLIVRTHLEPYVDVQAVRELDTEIRRYSRQGSKGRYKGGR